MTELPRLGEVADYGYAYDCDHLCDQCIGDLDTEAHYLSSHEETDSPMHCCCCGALIPGSLTEEGRDYVLDAWAKDPHGELQELWREEFAWAFPCYGDPEFNRFDICEAWFLWAHDYGQYDIITRLQDIGFKPKPRMKLSALSGNAYSIYCKLVRAHLDKMSGD